MYVVYVYVYIYICHICIYDIYIWHTYANLYMYFTYIYIYIQHVFTNVPHFSHLDRSQHCPQLKSIKNMHITNQVEWKQWLLQAECLAQNWIKEFDISTSRCLLMPIIL